MDSKARVFVDSPAVREKVPLLVGIVGASGCGKTYSALRLATGIQRVYGGDVGVIDSEAKRALHYADRFKFLHLPFSPPFSPSDYGAAIEHFRTKGVKTVVVDSFSHEHAGQGGVLEMHEAEVSRLSRGDTDRAERVKMLAWQRPKAERMKLINLILQAGCNFIFTYRAKEKLRLERGKEPTQMGWMPIAGDEYVYESTVNILLMPNSGGVPAWHPEEMGEKAIVKLPTQFKDIFAAKAPLSEDIGAKLAEWAAGGAPPKSGNSSPAAGAAPASVNSASTGPAQPTNERPWMKRLQASVGALKLGENEARGLKGKEREAVLRTARLAYLSWCAGRPIESSNDLTDGEADLVIRRAELGEMPGEREPGSDDE